MKQLIILIFGCCIGWFLGYMKGYVKGFNDAVESYAPFYDKLVSLYKTAYEELKRKIQKQG